MTVSKTNNNISPLEYINVAYKQLSLKPNYKKPTRTYNSGLKTTTPEAEKGSHLELIIVGCKKRLQKPNNKRPTRTYNSGLQSTVPKAQ